LTHIPIMVQVVDEVVPDGALCREDSASDKVITSCFNCGGIYFYQAVEYIGGTQFATDTTIYCAQCGQMQSGYFNDPVDELDEKMRPKEERK